MAFKIKPFLKFLNLAPQLRIAVVRCKLLSVAAAVSQNFIKQKKILQKRNVLMFEETNHVLYVISIVSKHLCMYLCLSGATHSCLHSIKNVCFLNVSELHKFFLSNHKSTISV